MGLFGKKKKKEKEYIIPTIITKTQEAMEDPTIILVDSRSYEEYCEGHIPGSINFPYDDFVTNESLAGEVFPDKDAKIYLYSLNGDWSWSSELLFKDLGYSNVEHIGNLTSWVGTHEIGDPNMPSNPDEPEVPTE